MNNPPIKLKVAKKPEEMSDLEKYLEAILRRKESRKYEMSVSDFLNSDCILMTSRNNYRGLDNIKWDGTIKHGEDFDELFEMMPTVEERIYAIGLNQLEENGRGEELLDEYNEIDEFRFEHFTIVDLVNVAYSDEIIDDLLATYDAAGGEEVVSFINEVKDIARNTSYNQEQMDKALEPYRGQKFVLLDGYTRLAILRKLCQSDADLLENTDLADTKLIFEEAEFDAAWDYAFSELALTDDSEQNEEILKGKSDANLLMFVIKAFNENAGFEPAGCMGHGYGITDLVFKRIESLVKNHRCSEERLKRIAEEAYNEHKAHKELRG